MKQKFKRGDRVHIAKKMPSMMSHFDKDLDAIIAYSYNDEYGGGPQMVPEDKEDDEIEPYGTDEYAVYILPEGYFCAWYPEALLTAVKGAHGLRLAETLKLRHL